MSSVGLRGRGWRWRIIMGGRCDERGIECIVRALFGGIEDMLDLWDIDYRQGTARA